MCKTAPFRPFILHFAENLCETAPVRTLVPPIPAPAVVIPGLSSFMPRFPGGRRRGDGSMRVSAGSHGVGKALDGELAQLGRGLTSAQTDAVIPVGHAPSLAARVRRNPNSAVTPPPPDVTLSSHPFFHPSAARCNRLTLKASVRTTSPQGPSWCFLIRPSVSNSGAHSTFL